MKIRYFCPTVAIIRSKQRPRKIRVVGEDGREYVFLLKGHEDLRQDERAMQLFGLVNALLYHDRRTGSESHDLSIQRYAVVPLSPTAGLISWVPNTDTLHDLIRDYREQKKILRILGLAMIAGIICCTVIHLNECTPVQPCFDLPELLPVE